MAECGAFPLFTVTRYFILFLYYKDGDTAVMWAACAGHLEVLSRLIDSGAGVDIANEV